MKRKFLITTAAVVGGVVLIACGNSKSAANGSDGGSMPSTFMDEATMLAERCTDDDAGLHSLEMGIFTPADFCTLYLATCPPSAVKGALTDTQSCMDNYNAAASLSDGDMQHCRSNHLCNASTFFPMDFIMHCNHAIGIGLCN